MTTSKRIGVGQLAIWTSCTIVIILCLLQPAEVKAQWTTPDGSGKYFHPYCFFFNVDRAHRTIAGASIQVNHLQAVHYKQLY